LNPVAIKSLPAVQKALSPAFKKFTSDKTPKAFAGVVVNNYAAYISTFNAVVDAECQHFSIVTGGLKA